MPSYLPDDMPDNTLEPTPELPPDQTQQNLAAASGAGYTGSSGNGIGDVVVQGGAEVLGEAIASGTGEVLSTGAEVVGSVVEGGLSAVGEGIGGCLSGCSLIILLVLGLAGAAVAASSW